jgi:hypothetical protein
MNIITLIVYIVEALPILGFLYLGCLYVKETKATCETNGEKEFFNKQAYVKTHRNVFGINERECSDTQKVYTISPERMGF